MENQESNTLCSALSSNISADWMPKLNEHREDDPDPYFVCNTESKQITILQLVQGCISEEIISWEWIQRVPQWKLARKLSFLKVSFHEGIHIPEIILVEVPDEDSPLFDNDYKRLKEEYPNVKYIILDGAHRMRTLREYMEGKLECLPPREYTGNFSKMPWNKLTRKEQELIMNRLINVAKYYDTPSNKLGPIFVAVNEVDDVSAQQKLHSSGGTFKQWFVDNGDTWIKKHPWMNKTNKKRDNDKEVLQFILGYEYPDVAASTPKIRGLWNDHKEKKYDKLAFIKRTLKVLEGEYENLHYLDSTRQKAKGSSYWTTDAEILGKLKGHVMCVFQTLSMVENSNKYEAKEYEKLVKQISRKIHELYCDEETTYKVTDGEVLFRSLSKGIKPSTDSAVVLERRVEVLRKLVDELDMAEPMTPRRRDISDEDFRRILFNRQDGRCVYTGVRLDLYDRSSYVADHVTPVSKGGSDSDIDNFVLVAAAANSSKGKKLLGSEDGEYNPPTGWRPEHGWLLMEDKWVDE